MGMRPGLTQPTASWVNIQSNDYLQEMKIKDVSARRRRIERQQDASFAQTIKNKPEM